MSGNLYNQVSSLKLGRYKKTKRDAKSQSEPSPFSRSNASNAVISSPVVSSSATSSATSDGINGAQSDKSMDAALSVPKVSDSNSSWPPSLNQFVNECFQKSTELNELQKGEFNTQIQQLLAKAVSQNKLWENNWQVQTLPIFHTGPREVELECNSMQNSINPSSTHYLPSRSDSKIESKQNKKRKKSGLQSDLQSDSQNLPNAWVSPSYQPSADTKKNTKKLKKQEQNSAFEVDNVWASSPSDSPAPQKTPNDLTSSFLSNERKQQRMARFSDSLTPEPSNSKKSSTKRRKGEPFVGTCTTLEKQYLRLTSEPEPSRVRPQHILEKSFAFVLNKYRSEGAPYSYLNNQFKSIRQDLTVQHIRNDLTSRVYEAHARIAIENNDLGEFNQCQSQLKYLYFLRRQTSNDEVDKEFVLLDLEFTAYRILYMLMMGNHSEIFKIRYDVYTRWDKTKFKSLKERQLFDCVERAFDLQSYQIQGDYHRYFTVYKFFKSIKHLKLGYYLIENFLVNRERVRALDIISRTYRKVPVEFLLNEFGFKSSSLPNKKKASDETVTNNADDSAETFDKFLSQYNLAQFVINGCEFDCAAARPVVQGITVQTGFRKIDIKGQV